MRFPRLRDAEGVAGLSGVAGTANEFRRASGGEDDDESEGEGDAAESVILVTLFFLEPQSRFYLWDSFPPFFPRE